MESSIHQHKIYVPTKMFEFINSAFPEEKLFY